MNPRPPYLSIVATARNDDHGGNLLGRMHLFLRGLIEQCARHRLPAEVVLVEWNPPVDRPGLAEVLDVPAEPWCPVRVVQVPGDVHHRLDHSEQLPLFQMIAKNVGIRRARGRFVLATNVDLLFNDALMAHLARQRLPEQRMLRIDRTDVAGDVPADAALDAQLDWCEAHIIRENRRDLTLDLRTHEAHRIYHPLDRRNWLLEKLQDWDLIPVVTRKRLHLNGCGDFTLMHRDRWARVRGYPEFAMFSMHLDAVLCTQAHFDGTREMVLEAPMRCYHIEHAVGSGWSPEGQSQLNARLESKGIPQTSNEQFHLTATGMRRKRAPRIYNQPDWGMAEEVFDELLAGSGCVADPCGARAVAA